MILSMPALIFLLYAQTSQQAAFGHNGAFIDTLLILGGPVTAIPLIGFAYGARRIPYSLIGILQYISPTLVFLTAVFMFHEPLDKWKLLSFVILWIGLAIYSYSALMEEKNRRAEL